MKQLLIIIFSFYAISSMASDKVYDCRSISNLGKIKLIDLEDNSIVLDLSEHDSTFKDLAYLALNELVVNPDKTHRDFVVQIGSDNFNRGFGRKFENSFKKIVLKSIVSQTTQTCRFDLVLNKVNEIARLSYTCTTLFKKVRVLEDKLDCTYQE